MNTRHAEYKTEIGWLAEAMAKRDKDNFRFHIGLWIAAVVVLGVLIRLPG